MPIVNHWADIPARSSNASVAKRLLAGGGADLVRVEIKAGTVADCHAHPHEQFVQVLAGAGTLETMDGRQDFSAGSVFHFPAETWHAAVFDEDTILVETNLKGS